MPEIVCKFCGHGKHWHRFDPDACLALDGPYSCDCPAWEYGKDITGIPIPEEEDI